MSSTNLWKPGSTKDTAVDAVGDGDGDGPAKDAGSDASMPPVGTLPLSDGCSANLPEVISSEMSMTLGVTGLVSSVAESGECSVAPDVR